MNLLVQKCLKGPLRAREKKSSQAPSKAIRGCRNAGTGHEPGESLDYSTHTGVTHANIWVANGRSVEAGSGKLVAAPHSRHQESPAASSQDPRCMSVASISLGSFQSMQQLITANAPGIQLVSGLVAAVAIGRALLQWPPPSATWAPATAGGPGQSPSESSSPAPTASFSLSGVDDLLQEAQGEIKNVEQQLQELQASRQAARLQQAEREQRAALEAPSSTSTPSTSNDNDSIKLPLGFKSGASSTATALQPPPQTNINNSSTATSTTSPSSSPGSSPSSSEGQGGAPAQPIHLAPPPAQPQPSAPPQRWPSFSLPFQAPPQPKPQPTQPQPSTPPPFQEPSVPKPQATQQPSPVPPFAQPAELTVPGAPAPAPAPAPRPSTFPLADPFAGKSLISLKSSLLDEVLGTARGVTTTSRQRGAIEELILALEARNPCPKPTQSMSLMEGTWKLAYTTNTQTLMMLNAIDALPLVDLGNVYQEVDAASMTAINKISIAIPLAESWPLELSTEARFEVRTPRAFKVHFTRLGVDTYIQTPQLLTALEIPESISVLGNDVDLTPLRDLIINPFNAGLESAQTFIQGALNPDIGVQASELGSAWMLSTYLDETLRITRDDAGRVFVLMKDDPLLASELQL